MKRPFPPLFNRIHRINNRVLHVVAYRDKALDVENRANFINRARAAMHAWPQEPKVPNLAAVAALQRSQLEIAAPMTAEGIRTIGESTQQHRTVGVWQHVNVLNSLLPKSRWGNHFLWTSLMPWPTF